MASWIVADKLHGTARHDLAKRSPPMVMVSFQMTVADVLAISEGEVSQEYITLKLTTSPRVGHLSLTGTRASTNGLIARFLGCCRKTTTKKNVSILGTGVPQMAGY